MIQRICFCLLKEVNLIGFSFIIIVLEQEISLCNINRSLTTVSTPRNSLKVENEKNPRKNCDLVCSVHNPSRPLSWRIQGCSGKEREKQMVRKKLMGTDSTNVWMLSFFFLYCTILFYGVMFLSFAWSSFSQSNNIHFLVSSINSFTNYSSFWSGRTIEISPNQSR